MCADPVTVPLRTRENVDTQAVNPHLTQETLQDKPARPVQPVPPPDLGIEHPHSVLDDQTEPDGVPQQIVDNQPATPTTPFSSTRPKRSTAGKLPDRLKDFRVRFE